MPVTKCAQKLVDVAGIGKDGKPLITNAEAERILKELSRRANGEGPSRDLAQTLLKKAREMKTEWEYEQKFKEFKAYLNFAKEHQLLAELKGAKNKANTLFGMSIGTPEIRHKAGDSADSRGNLMGAEYWSRIVRGLEEQNLLDAFSRDTYDEALGVELANLNELTPKAGPVSGSEVAHNIAKVIHDVRKELFARANDAGAGIRFLAGYVAKNTHDPVKIAAAGVEEWSKYMLKALDPRVFEDVADPREFLADAYHGLVSGVHFKYSMTEAEAQAQGSSLVRKKLGQERLFHWKDGAKGWHEYNRQFGQTNIRETIASQIMNTSKVVALMERFGPDWDKNYLKVWDYSVKETKRKAGEGDAKAAKLLKDPAYVDEHVRKRLVEGLSGVMNNPVDMNLARFGAVARTGLTVTRMGSSVIASLMDFPSSVLDVKYQGATLPEAIGSMFREVTASLTAKQRAEFSEHVNVDLEGTIGELTRQMFSADALPGVASNISRLYMKWNLQTPWNNAVKSGAARATSWLFAKRLTEGTFESVGELYAGVLSRYGIGKTEFDLIKQHMIFDHEGRKYVGQSMAYDIPDEALTAAYGDKTPWQIKQRKRELSTAVSMLFWDRANISVPTPGLKEHLFLLRGTRPGTGEGEALRFVMQFKSFPVTHVTKVWGRETIGRVPGGVESSSFFPGVAQGLGEQWRTAVPGMVGMVTAMTIMGYVSMSAKDLTKGLTPRDPRDPRAWGAAFMQGGGAGIMGDFMFGEYNRYGRSFAETLAGPAVGVGGEVRKVWDDFIRGDEDAAGNAAMFFNKNNPITGSLSSLFYLRPAMNYLLNYNVQEWINPGSLRRRERRIERDQGQTFMVPPSSLY